MTIQLFYQRLKLQIRIVLDQKVSILSIFTDREPMPYITQCYTVGLDLACKLAQSLVATAG